MKTSKKKKRLHKNQSSVAKEKNNSEKKPLTSKPVMMDQTDFIAFNKKDASRIAGCVMKWLNKLYESCGAVLSDQYRSFWRKFTEDFLKERNNHTAWVCGARAGSGKTMWLTAFALALCDLKSKNDPVYQMIEGGLILVVQKIETLNALVEVIENHFPDSSNLVGAVQSLSDSGKKKGLCKNREAHEYEDCIPDECPYASGCPIANSFTSGKKALIIGITQSRFQMNRKSKLAMDDLMNRKITMRDQTDQKMMETNIPRRFLFFDERFEMAETESLSKELLNQFSSELEKLSKDHNLADIHAASLQYGLSFGITRHFDASRVGLRVEEVDGRKYDFPYGFFSMRGQSEAVNSFLTFQNRLSENTRISTSSKGQECINVMNNLITDDCLFVKTNGFRIVHVNEPKLIYGSAQTLIFDATAEVDGDYKHLKNIRFYSNVPSRKFKNVMFHLYCHPNCNVSKSAMRAPSKVTGVKMLVNEILKKETGPVFLSTYKEQSQMLFGGEIPAQIRQVNGGLPYYGGTNGSNDFRECQTVILLGWPRLSPDELLIKCYAAWGDSGLKNEIAAAYDQFCGCGIPKDPFRLLPGLKRYEQQYLAARVEQEIYRSAVRIPNFKGDIHIFMFYPPEGIWEIIKERFPGCRSEVIEDSPECIKIARGRSRKYHGAPTAFASLCEYLEVWNGTEIDTAKLRDEVLHISKATWHDLMQDKRAKSWLAQHGITRKGRGKNAKFVREANANI